ncbi:ATP-binding cassette domain-containing protein [Clostridium sp. UBA1056]|uniref:ABC transporter ATP-binding protein/permease n=1 Tax=unclassified Clostridium TaxID=2614128 RepID=UPI0032180B51
MIRIENINKIYNPEKTKPLKALNNINLEFSKGEFVCILGKSGSGKSTLLNIIAGLDKPTDGTISVDGKDISKFKDIEMANLRKDKIGFIFQDFQLLEHLTVIENVELGLSMDVMDRKEKRRRAKQVLVKVGLENHIDHKPSELSGGQKQRVSIARALVKQPEIIIADEPTGALDTKTTEDIMNLLVEISQTGKLVIVVTHNEDFKDYASRIVELKDGQVIENYNKEESIVAEDIEESRSKDRKFDILSAFKLSMKRIIEKRVRYFLVSLSLIIGICSLSIALGTSQGIRNYTEYANQRIVDNKKLSFTKKGLIDSEDYFNIRKNKSIRLIQDEYVLDGKVKANDNEIDYKVKSIIQDEYKKYYTTPEIVYGKLPEDGKSEIVFSEDIAKKLVKDGDISSLVGQEIETKLLAHDPTKNYPSRWDTQKLTVSGISKKTLIGEDYAYMPYEAQKNIVKRSRFIGTDENIPTNNLTVYLKDSNEVEEVYRDYNQKYSIIRPADILKDLTKMFKNYNILILCGTGLILFISALMIGIILFISVIERQREIGLFISIGGTRDDIKKIFISEGLILGMIASFVGVLISIIGLWIINPLSTKSMGYPIFAPNILTVIEAFSMGVLVSLISSLLPANKASKLSPIDLLRRN